MGTAEATFSQTKHGHGRRKSRTGTYHSWAGVISRCLNPNEPAFPYYGGRGIQVCERWRDFRNFLTDMGERPNGLTIDRIDVDGNYEPGNCRWATRLVQSQNRRPVLVCKRGLHQLVPENRIGRYCRECRNAYLREWRAAR